MKKESASHPSLLFEGCPKLENRGVLHSVWPGPLWTDFSPIERTFQKSFGDGTAMIFDDLSHGVHDFSVEGPEHLSRSTLLVTFLGPP